MLQAAEQTKKAAEAAADTWVNSGWQVKKRAGQIIPEIRPNAVDVEGRSARLLPPTGAASDSANGRAAGGSGSAASASIAPLDIQAASSLVQQNDAQLAEELVGYLSVVEEEGGFERTSSGGLLFESEAALSRVVLGFTKQKLQELAVGARALARYVNDLEGELESADEEVVSLRKQLSAGERARKEAERSAAQLQAQQSELQAQLSSVEQSVAMAAAAEAESEARAERAAAEVLRLQSALEKRRKLADGAQQVGEGGEAQLAAEQQRVVELEERLIEAEAEAREGEAVRARLRALEKQLETQQAAAAKAMEAESSRLESLRLKAEMAEQQAEAASQKLAASIAESEAKASELERLLATSQKLQAAANASSTEASADARGSAAFEADDDAVLEAQAALLQQLRASGGTVPGGESTSLHDRTDTAAPTAAAARLQALSRMKRAELIVECEERGLEGVGTVAELRSRLRVERKRAALIQELQDRGWSEQQARRALASCEWDLEAAIDKLVGRS